MKPDGAQTYLGTDHPNSLEMRGRVNGFQTRTPPCPPYASKLRPRGRTSSGNHVSEERSEQSRPAFEIAGAVWEIYQPTRMHTE